MYPDPSLMGGDLMTLEIRLAATVHHCSRCDAIMGVITIKQWIQWLCYDCGAMEDIEYE